MNTSDREERIDELLEHAAQISLDEREKFLQARCADDPSLLAMLKGVFADTDDIPAEFLGGEDGAQGNEPHERIDRLYRDHPAVIGSYRILREIGRGGMGVVYEAEQENPKRHVALKLVQTSIKSPELFKRLKREAFLLGQLKHPGIAHIYESGTLEMDRRTQPFFAMEFVEGEDIRTYVVDKGLSIRKRLELLARVCDAVHHAHQKSIIHRDLKPANILVVDEVHSNEDQRTSTPSTETIGQPKILDFGVARFTESDMAATTLQTTAGQIIGTLSYMSPEQLSGDRSRIDSRCDIYAIGVIMYEILVGKLPFDTCGKSIAEAARIIQADDPTYISEYDRTLRGDVESIVAKSLEKDPSRRYASVAQMAMDIRRHLRNEPIEARPASAIYKIRKFTNRNAGLVCGALATIFALVFGLTGTTFYMFDARKQRDEAIAAREAADVARIEETLSREMSDAVTLFFTELLESASPSQQGKDVSVREVIGRARVGLGKRFDRRPTVEARIRTTIGKTLLALGDYADAKQELSAACELWGCNSSNPNSDALETLDRIAEACYFLGEYDQAEAIAKNALDRTRASAAPDDSRLLQNLNMCGFLAMKRGRFEEAEPLLLEAATLAGESEPSEQEASIDAVSNLALLYTLMRRTDASERQYYIAIERSRSLRGEKHPATLLIKANLASLYIQEHENAKALPLLRESIAGQEETLGENHSKTLITLHNLACVLEREGDAESSIAMLRDGFSRAESAYGEQSPSTLMFMHTIGRILLNADELEESERHLTQALQLRTKVYGPRHSTTMESRYELMRLYLAQNDWEQATALGESYFAEEWSEHTTQSTDSWYWSKMLGIAYAGNGKYAEAEERFLTCHDLATSDDMKSDIRSQLESLYRDWGRLDEAAKWQ